MPSSQYSEYSQRERLLPMTMQDTYELDPMPEISRNDQELWNSDKLICPRINRLRRHEAELLDSAYSAMKNNEPFPERDDLSSLSEALRQLAKTKTRFQGNVIMALFIGFLLWVGSWSISGRRSRSQGGRQSYIFLVRLEIAAITVALECQEESREKLRDLAEDSLHKAFDNALDKLNMPRITIPPVAADEAPQDFRFNLCHYPIHKYEHLLEYGVPRRIEGRFVDISNEVKNQWTTKMAVAQLSESHLENLWREASSFDGNGEAWMCFRRWTIKRSNSCGSVGLGDTLWSDRAKHLRRRSMDDETIWRRQEPLEVSFDVRTERSVASNKSSMKSKSHFHVPERFRPGAPHFVVIGWFPGDLEEPIEELVMVGEKKFFYLLHNCAWKVRT